MAVVRRLHLRELAVLSLRRGAEPELKMPKRSHRRAVLPSAVVIATYAVLGAMMSPATADSCPASLTSALRLVVVTAADMNAPAAMLETFEREGSVAPWRPVGGLRNAVVGLKGLAWGAGFRHLAADGEPLKQEGDKRSPMGIYTIGAPFGADDQMLPGYMKLELGRHVCVEEPSSESYGRIVPASAVGKGVKYDEMAKEVLYRRGVVIDYPADAANKAGSCIFIHVWRQPGKGTAGCVALDEADVATLRTWTVEKPSAIAILSAAAKARFAACLP